MKLVINIDYGGFSLSEEAVLLARQLSGDSKWGRCVLKGESYEDGTVSDLVDSYHLDDTLRSDPILVKVVEQLGDKANGGYASLKIVDLPKGTKYRIQEYDGHEWIETADSIKWQVAT